ncbi:hypothetical protein H5410_030526 [Solanum commersonii]|uniref:Uncharacterized protein n=1 Tax=Solanum commersonii TaxID=4109 RepID=A0A9J5YIY1_SOLCO|nr:hypothetical protein H5410_030526 [Solanum commersonii]
MKSTKRWIAECIGDLDLLRRRGRKTKTTKLIAGGIGSKWVQLERMNPSPFLTHSTRESE